VTEETLHTIFIVYSRIPLFRSNASCRCDRESIDLRCRVLGRRLSILKREGYEPVRAGNFDSIAIEPF